MTVYVVSVDEILIKVQIRYGVEYGKQAAGRQDMK